MGKKSEEVGTPSEKKQGWDPNKLPFTCTGHKNRDPVLKGQSQVRQELAIFCQSMSYILPAS